MARVRHRQYVFDQIQELILRALLSVIQDLFHVRQHLSPLIQKRGTGSNAIYHGMTIRSNGTFKYSVGKNASGIGNRESECSMPAADEDVSEYFSE